MFDLKFIILGLLQGITEFLPISSTAHLNLAAKAMGIAQGKMLVNDVILHAGTLCSMVLFFRREIIAALKDINKLKKIFAVTLITGLAGILIKDFLETVFSSTYLMTLTLLVNGLMLLTVTKFCRDKSLDKNITFPVAAIMGFTQIFALLPGISRSGTTISTLLFLKINKEEAFNFSFLAAIPLISGAFLVSLKDIGGLPNISFPLLTGAFIAFITGLAALHWLKQLVIRLNLKYFGYYCCFLAVFIFCYKLLIK